MNLETLRNIVDQTPALIGQSQGSLEDLYVYVGLDYLTTPQKPTTVSDALYEQIRKAFTSGHGEAMRLCRHLQTDLIREHVINGSPLSPYFDVLDHIRDALRGAKQEAGDITGDWSAAVRAAQDNKAISNWSLAGQPENLERIYAREFSVARAANYLRQKGYGIRLEPNFIALEESAEKSLVADVEKLITRLGGLNIARKIFATITPYYDIELQRYQLVPSISQSGGGIPQVPWGYILQLAVKNIDGQKPYLNLEEHWPQLLSLITAYAAVIDVQPYVPTAWHGFDAKGLVKHLQEQALYDSMFRFLQLRSTDVLKICKGALSFLDEEVQTPGGWSLKDAFDVISYLVDPVRDVRGPEMVDEAQVIRALSHIPRDRVVTVLRDVLAHSQNGPNRHFSLPTDAPTATDQSMGADFYLKPLIRRPGNRYLIVDRAMSGWGYLEALLTALRSHHKQFDDKVGLAVEGFLATEFAAHGISTIGGDYDVDGHHGECDLVIEASGTVVFLELKKKSLTRRARAGSDAHLLLDLSGSLLAAQAQLGWHELRLGKEKSLQLERDGVKNHLKLNERSIEKVAVGMLDFGSFQDRILLKQFLEATLNVNFGTSDPGYAKKFDEFNAGLREVREQYNEAHKGKSEVHQPFFNCWFVSVPQLLILLDGVTDEDSFKNALWTCRHFTTGASDFYYEISYMRRMKAEAKQGSTS